MVNLETGSNAPNFKALDQNGNMVQLEDFRGTNVILFFYPKDNTPTCTKEACNLRDNLAELQSKGYAVIGVSNDNVSSHKKFETKYKLPFPLLADTDKKIVNDYGVWGEKKLFGIKYLGIFRKTFVICPEGKIKHIIHQVKSGAHAQQIMKLEGI